MNKNQILILGQGEVLKNTKPNTVNKVNKLVKVFANCSCYPDKSLTTEVSGLLQNFLIVPTNHDNFWDILQISTATLHWLR